MKWPIAAAVALAAVASMAMTTEPQLKADRLSADITGDFCFISFGCWGGLNKASQKRVADVMGAVAQHSPAPVRFVIAAGDNFYKKGVTGVVDPRFISTFDAVYSHPALSGVPFLVALGNHDYRGDFFAQVNYTSYQLRQSPPRSTMRWYLPHTYYVKRVHRDMAVFVLDCPLLERCANNGDASARCWDHGAQRSFFVNQLAEMASVRWKVVVCHYPLFANGPHLNLPWLVEWLQPLLDKHCVDLYINADNHYLQVSKVRHVWYVNSGGGAGFGLRHLPSQKGYHKSPHNQFVAFDDGVFLHCVYDSNITSKAINQETVLKYEFTTDWGPKCHSDSDAALLAKGGDLVKTPRMAADREALGGEAKLVPLDGPASATIQGLFLFILILAVPAVGWLLRKRRGTASRFKDPMR